MKALFIALLVYFLLDTIASIAIVCRAKKNGLTLKSMAIILKDFWNGNTLVNADEADYE